MSKSDKTAVVKAAEGIISDAAQAIATAEAGIASRLVQVGIALYQASEVMTSKAFAPWLAKQAKVLGKSPITLQDYKAAGAVALAVGPESVGAAGWATLRPLYRFVSKSERDSDEWTAGSEAASAIWTRAIETRPAADKASDKPPTQDRVAALVLKSGKQGTSGKSATTPKAKAEKRLKQAKEAAAGETTITYDDAALEATIKAVNDHVRAVVKRFKQADAESLPSEVRAASLVLARLCKEHGDDYVIAGLQANSK